MNATGQRMKVAAVPSLLTQELLLTYLLTYQFRND